jgi:hypothetical protein
LERKLRLARQRTGSKTTIGAQRHKRDDFLHSGAISQERSALHLHTCLSQHTRAADVVAQPDLTDKSLDLQRSNTLYLGFQAINRTFKGRCGQGAQKWQYSAEIAVCIVAKTPMWIYHERRSRTA